MKKQLLFIACLLFSAGISFAQVNKKTSSKQAVPELTKLLSEIGLPYKVVNDSLAAIPYEGDNIENYQVVIQKVSDLYIIYTNLSEAIPDKLTVDQYKYLLEQNDFYDVVKISLSGDGVFYLRADLYRSIATSVILKRLIKQVANAANIIAGELK